MSLGQKPKIKNWISFGQESSTQFNHDMSNDLLIQKEDSFSFDYQRQARSLGLAFNNVSEKDLACIIDSKMVKVTRAGDVVKRLRQIAGKIQSLKSELVEIKQRQINMSKSVSIQPIINLIIQHERLQQKLSMQRQSRRKNNLSIESSSIYIKINPQNSQKFVKSGQNNDIDTNLRKQINELKYCLQLKNNQIQVLNSQIYTMRELSQKKDLLHNEKIKMKEIQWERKLEDILRDYRQRSHTSKENHETKSWRTDNSRKRDADQSVNSVLYQHRCNTEANEQDFIFNIREFRVNNKQKKIWQNEDRGKLNNWSDLKNGDEKERKGWELRVSKTGRQRKKSTELPQVSYFQTKTKIQKMQNWLQKQIQNISTQ